MSIEAPNGGIPFLCDVTRQSELGNDPTIMLWQNLFLDGSSEGRFASISEIRTFSDNKPAIFLLTFYEVDLDGDHVNEIIVLPDDHNLPIGHGLAVTILTHRSGSWKPLLWIPETASIPGDIWDIRDYNGDGTLDVTFVLAQGRTDYMASYIVAWNKEEHLRTTHFRHPFGFNLVSLSDGAKYYFSIESLTDKPEPGQSWVPDYVLFELNSMDVVPNKEASLLYLETLLIPDLLYQMLDDSDGAYGMLTQKVAQIRKLNDILARAENPRELDSKQQANILKSKTLMARNQNLASIQLLDIVLSQAPKHQEALSLLATAVMRSGKVYKGFPHLYRLLQFNPDDPYAWLILGMSYLANRDGRTASSCFELAFRFAEDTQSVNAVLNHFLKKSTQPWQKEQIRLALRP